MSLLNADSDALETLVEVLMGRNWIQLRIRRDEWSFHVALICEQLVSRPQPTRYTRVLKYAQIVTAAWITGGDVYGLSRVVTYDLRSDCMVPDVPPIPHPLILFWLLSIVMRTIDDANCCRKKTDAPAKAFDFRRVAQITAE